MNSKARRIIVVLGYSVGTSDQLHPICEERLVHASTIATNNDVVVLSGWARGRSSTSEAELMADAWSGVHRELVIDPTATTTVENADNSMNDIHRVGATEVVIVTSRWHAPRARAAFYWRLRPEDISLRTDWPVTSGRTRYWLREAACWLVLPFQLERENAVRRLRRALRREQP